MHMELAELQQFAACAAQARYIAVAVYSWVMYDWLITFGQEIDLVWKRSGAWTSKLLYGFTRYQGLAIMTLNMIVAINSGWSTDFCHSYFYVLGFAGAAHTFAVQGALLLRIYVMYHRSMTILIISSFFFACEVVSLMIIMGVDISHYKGLSFETYLCALVLGPAVSYMRSTKQTSGAKLLSILIRDSFLWYFSLAGCLLVNAVAWTTSTPTLVVIGLPVLNSASTIGGSRLLLNLRAAYFVKDPKSGSDGFRFEKTTDFLDTEGTVGKFWSPAMSGRDNDDDGVSISMGVWSNEDVQRDGPPTPPQPVIMLKPALLGRRRGLVSSNGICIEAGGAPAQLEESAVSGSGRSPTHGEVEIDQQQPADEVPDSQEIDLQFRKKILSAVLKTRIWS
ncbi:hypothetical protein FRB90_009264 [Tulasnella sp. 427]|nr:hypothetical protein FRB90_009264 [Tulasnella sp. 427]